MNLTKKIALVGAGLSILAGNVFAAVPDDTVTSSITTELGAWVTYIISTGLAVYVAYMGIRFLPKLRQLITKMYAGS